MNAYFCLIVIKLNLNSHMWLMATMWDSTDLMSP